MDIRGAHIGDEGGLSGRWGAAIMALGFQSAHDPWQAMQISIKCYTVVVNIFFNPPPCARRLSLVAHQSRQAASQAEHQPTVPANEQKANRATLGIDNKDGRPDPVRSANIPRRWIPLHPSQAASSASIFICPADKRPPWGHHPH